MKRIVFCLTCLLYIQNAFAWNGQATDTGDSVEIESGEYRTFEMEPE